MLKFSIVVTMTPGGVLDTMIPMTTARSPLSVALPETAEWTDMLTEDKVCIMGRNTWESRPREAWVGRTCIVLTTGRQFNEPGFLTARDWTAAVGLATQRARRVYVLGGVSVFADVLEEADEIHAQVLVADITSSIVWPGPLPFPADTWDVEADNSERSLVTNAATGMPVPIFRALLRRRTKPAGAAAIQQPQPTPQNGQRDAWEATIDHAEQQRARYTSDGGEADPARERLIRDMRARQAFGLSKYGVPVTADNGRDHHVDGYQELLDACVYYRAAAIQAGAMNHQVNGFAGIVQNVALQAARLLMEHEQAASPVVSMPLQVLSTPDKIDPALPWSAPSE